MQNDFHQGHNSLNHPGSFRGFGGRLAQLFERVGKLSIVDCSKLLGVSANSLRSYLAEKRVPSGPVLIRLGDLARQYGMSLDDLIFGGGVKMEVRELTAANTGNFYVMGRTFCERHGCALDDVIIIGQQGDMLGEMVADGDDVVVDTARVGLGPGLFGVEIWGRPCVALLQPIAGGAKPRVRSISRSAEYKDIELTVGSDLKILGRAVALFRRLIP